MNTTTSWIVLRHLYARYTHKYMEEVHWLTKRKKEGMVNQFNSSSHASVSGPFQHHITTQYFTIQLLFRFHTLKSQARGTFVSIE